MNTPPNAAKPPRRSFTFDAVPEDEDKQDELNRLMRKPGETKSDGLEGLDSQDLAGKPCAAQHHPPK
ncbi:MAG TPA: hypothetical protein VE988_02195 [Gemmataceae bacterium]|nr:hypothetical protein [Gemmataceae bacterium]